MKTAKTTIVAFILFVINISGYTQQKRVVFDYDRSNFNDGASLPAESYFTLSGAISKQTTIVEVDFFFKNNKENKPPLYSKTWKRGHGNSNESFDIDINFRLRGNSQYDVRINYFRKASDLEIQNLRFEIDRSLDTYIDQNILTDDKKIKILDRAGGLVDDMNSIVNSGLVNYRSKEEVKFRGFSDLVEAQIKKIEKFKVKRSGRDTLQTKKKYLAHEQQINNLKILIHSELSHFMNSEVSVLNDSKFVDNYQVEKVRSVITIHGGYGGVYLSGDLDNSSFGSSAMAGITLPLGKKAFSSAFWSRSSFNAGIFFTNFQGKDDVTISGPIINKPFYFGLGYKVFQFVRITGGATFLANKGSVNSINDVKTNTYLRPYLGIIADLNIWMDLAK